MISPPSDLVAVVQRALAEDIGTGDITTQVSIAPEAQARARIFAKQPGVLAGLIAAQEVWHQVDAQLKVTAMAQDGDPLATGQTVQEVEGSAASILIGERTALNFIQQLSGVATHTRKLVEATAGTHTKILDTRKTVPGLRLLQKYAVKCGGGENHRLGLYDRFLLKDNHLALFGQGRTLPEAIQAARHLQPDAVVEVEVDRMDQIPEVLSCKVDVILLDNMTINELESCVKLIAGRAKVEASGNMTWERIPAVAKTGVDFISVGALTHTVQALDFSLEII